MTTTDVERAGTRPGSSASARRPKAVLFCPSCGHESDPGGDWVRTDDPETGTRVLSCPECSRRLTERPLPDADDRETTSSRSPTSDGVFTVGGLWTGVVRAWLSLTSRRRVDS